MGRNSREGARRKFRIESDLGKKKVTQQWRTITPTRCKRMIGQIPNRRQKVIDLDEEQTYKNLYLTRRKPSSCECAKGHLKLIFLMKTRFQSHFYQNILNTWPLKVRSHLLLQQNWKNLAFSPKKCMSPGNLSCSLKNHRQTIESVTVFVLHVLG